MLPLVLAACDSAPPSDSASLDTSPVDTGDPCPELDCRDTFTGYVINAIGSPVSEFRVLATTDNGEDVQLDCPGGEDPLGACLSEAFELFVRFGTASLTLTDAAAERFVGEVTPEWADAVGRVEECGPSCDIASAEFRLE
jgi:hypothetical protein